LTIFAALRAEAADDSPGPEAAAHDGERSRRPSRKCRHLRLSPAYCRWVWPNGLTSGFPAASTESPLPAGCN
jgi:hypothetical protein